MTLEEVRAVLFPLALAMRADFDGPTQRAYQRQLDKVPAGLVQAAVEDMAGTGMRFFPNALEIKQMAERKRRQLLAAHPYTGCESCKGFPGYRTVESAGKQPTVERCPCKARYLEALASKGLRDALSDLPGEAGVGENERVYPTVEQLPAKVRQQVEAVAARKQLR